MFVNLSLVARIAYNILEKEAPQALEQANNILSVYSQSTPSMTSAEGDYPFVECAIFADTIKSKGGSFQSEWHFVNTPYLDQGGSVNDYPQFENGDNNVGNAIPAIVDWLTGANGYQNSFVYQGVKAHVHSEDDAKSYALRLLIHYLGDIHQPLHAVALVDDKYPKGDAGGNFIHLPPKGQVKNLHSVWDSLIYSRQDSPSMPYSSGGWNSLGSSVDTLTSKYTFSPTEFDSININEWVNDSFEMAKNFVYEGKKSFGNTPKSLAWPGMSALALIFCKLVANPSVVGVEANEPLSQEYI